MKPFNLYLKQIFKARLNWLPLSVSILVMAFLLVMNTSSESKVGFIASLDDNNEIMQYISSDYEDTLSGDLNSKDRNKIFEAQESLKQNIAQNLKAIDRAKVGDWSEALAIQVELMERNELADIESKIHKFDENYIRNTYGKYQRYKILQGLNLPPEFEGGESRGYTFLYRMLDTVFPIIFILCLITLLSDSFTRQFYDQIDLEDLFPVNQVTWQLDKLVKIYLISLLVYGVSFGLFFIVAGLVNGFSSYQYPISIYTDTYIETLPVWRLIAQTSVMHAFTILMTVIWVYLIAILTKEKLITLFVSGLTLIGGILLTGNIAPLAKVMHFIPTTYFFATRVITQQLAYENVNQAITYQNGLLLVSIVNLFLIVLIILIKSKRLHSITQLFKNE
ncbi:hypothetical protein ACQV2S_07010 [Facklamia sp. P13064]|uniref:hypothetical protein n=1 Tax=unclassified Facklamia TaxID=2622293 RepID=UPI003D183BCD